MHILKLSSGAISALLNMGSRAIFERSVFRPVFDKRALTRQRMIRVMEEEGVSCQEIIKVRRSGRCIARGEHPHYGKVVVKTSVLARNSSQVYTNLYLAELIQQEGGGLFPEIHRVALGHTVEAWVEGRELAKVKPEEIEASEIQDLLERLKRWSMAHATGGVMSLEDAQETAMKYAWTTRLRVGSQRKRTVIYRTWTICRNRKRLRTQLDRLQAMASEVRLPLCMAVTDITLRNLIREERTGTVLAIDHDLARHAHYGFDAVYILNSLYIRGVTPEVMDSLERYVFSEAYVGSEEAVSFFRCLYTTLNEFYEVLSR